MHSQPRASVSKLLTFSGSNIAHASHGNATSSCVGSRVEVSRGLGGEAPSEIWDDASTIDTKILEETRAWTGADEKFLAELIYTYLDDASEQISFIRRAYQTQNMETLRDIAHSLRPASSTMGATRLAELCEALEALVRQTEQQNKVGRRIWSEMSQLIEAIILEHQAVAIALRSYCSG